MNERLPRDQRRAQLLEVAYEIIQHEGTDALTLARLAARAGVSKPIAYDHFGTRAGLLGALYRFYEEQQTKAMRDALAKEGKTLQATATIVATAYIDCVLSTGPEYEEISAALLAYEETKDFLHDSRRYYAEEYRQVFSPFVKVKSAHSAVFVALVGSAEALARDAHNGEITRSSAIRTLTGMFIAALAPHAR